MYTHIHIYIYIYIHIYANRRPACILVSTLIQDSKVHLKFALRSYRKISKSEIRVEVLLRLKSYRDS